MNGTHLITLTELVSLIEECSRHGKAFTDELLLIRDCIEELKGSAPSNPQPIERLAIRVWNVAILEGRKQKVDENQLTLRVMACHLLEISMNTIRSFDLDITMNAVTFLSQTILLLIESKESEEKRHTPHMVSKMKKYIEEANTVIVEPIPKKYRKTLLSYYSCTANWNWTQGERDLSFDHFVQAKKQLAYIPEEAYTLSMSFYNSSLRLFNNQDFAQAVHWQKQAIDVFDVGKELNPTKQARNLRLLANIYFHMKDIPSAYQTVRLANEKYDSVAGHLLLLKISLEDLSSGIDIVPILHGIIQHPNATRSMCINACETTFTHNHPLIAISAVSRLEEKFLGDELLEEIWFCKLRMLLEQKNHVDAFAYVQWIVKQKVSGHPCCKSQLFHVELFRLAVTLFENDEIASALEWFGLAMEFLELLNGTDISKICRWKARCFLALFDLPHANEQLDMADQYEPNSLCTHYIRFLILLQHGNTAELCTMLESTEKKQGGDYQIYVEVMAEAAQRNGNTATTIRALSLLLQRSQFIQENGKYGQLLANWMRLQYSQFQRNVDVVPLEEVMKQLNESLRKCESSAGAGCGILFCFGESKDKTCLFLSHICWNMALTLRSSAEWEAARLFFEFAGSFCAFTSESKESLLFMISCLLVQSTCLLELIQQAGLRAASLQHIIHQLAKVASLSQEMVRKATSVGITCQKWRGTLAFLDLALFILQGQIPTSGPSNSSSSLHLKIECLANCPGKAAAAGLLENILLLPNLSVAARISILRKEIEMIVNQLPRDMKNVNRVYRKLVEVVGGAGTGQGIAQGQGQSLFEEIYSLLHASDPAILIPSEIEWFSIRAWNIAVSFSRRASLPAAERWMAIALKFANIHPGTSALHEKMLLGYKESLSSSLI